MVRGVVDPMVVVIPMILLLIDTHCLTLPRRRFCENYPFAPRCLGVAAKRSPSRTDIYKVLINKVLEDAMNENVPTDPGLSQVGRDSYTDKAETLSKLANMVISANQAPRNAFSDAGDSWTDEYIDFDASRTV